MSLEIDKESGSDKSPFTNLAEGVSDYLQPLGFPKERGLYPLSQCLTNIYNTGKVKAIELDVEIEKADGMIWLPVLKFNVILKSLDDFSDQQVEIIERIGNYHDQFSSALHDSPIETNISVKGPAQYPISDDFRVKLENRRISTAVKKPIAYLLFDKTTPILTTL